MIGKKILTVFLVMAMLLMGFDAALAQQQQTDVYDYEWYLKPAPREAGKAYLSFWNEQAPVLLTHDEQSDGMPYYWDIYYSYQEQGGVDFTVERVTEVFFNEANEVRDVFVTTGKACSSFCRNLTLKAGEMGGTNIIRPVSDDTGYGVAVSGTDANGSQRTFGFYVPLSQEIMKTYSLADVTAKAVREEGKAYMALTPVANPAPLLIESSDFDGGNGWFYGFDIHNDSEVAFTPSEMLEIFFYEGRMAGMHDLPAEMLVEWGAPEVYREDFCWNMSGGMPEQDVTGVGYILRGTDANGNKLEFCTYIELERK